MKQFCVLAALLALALAEPTIYFKETFEDGEKKVALGRVYVSRGCPQSCKWKVIQEAWSVVIFY